MIKNLSIENFKSILKDDINLKDFTVVIGANGTGKSNLVKALDFLATIPQIGLVATVNKFGGYEGIIPKAISANKVKKARVRFNYTTELPPPNNDLSNISHFTVDHDFEFGYSTKNLVRVTNEHLTFNNTFLMVELLREQQDNPLPKQNIETSSFELKKGSGRTVKYKESPPFSVENLNHYIDWFGLPFKANKLQSVKDIRGLLNFF